MKKETISKLQSLSRDQLFCVLNQAGINFPNTPVDKLTKEELLLVADEADEQILNSLLD